jgi:hypothetical protein
MKLKTSLKITSIFAFSFYTVSFFTLTNYVIIFVIVYVIILYANIYCYHVKLSILMQSFFLFFPFHVFFMMSLFICYNFCCHFLLFAVISPVFYFPENMTDSGAKLDSLVIVRKCCWSSTVNKYVHCKKWIFKNIFRSHEKN